MADYGIIIPIRSDLGGANVQVEDLAPNTSQKNSVYDGEGQSGYLTQQMDQPGATVFTGESFTSGSRNTTGASLDGADDWGPAAAVNLSGDAGHAGNDSRATAAPAFGLAAYLRERVCGDPAGDVTFLAFADADAVATAIIGRALAGLSLTVADIEVLLNAQTGKGERFDNAAGFAASGGSFGEVSDVLRILSGEVYYSPTNTIVLDAAGTFIPETHPDGIGEVVGGAVETRRGRILNLAGAGLTADPTPVSKGRFLVSGEPGYVGKRLHGLTTAFRASASGGKLRSLHDLATIELLNTNEYAYTAGTVDAQHPRAIVLDGTAVPATGLARFVSVYGTDGNLLNLP